MPNDLRARMEERAKQKSDKSLSRLTQIAAQREAGIYSDSDRVEIPLTAIRPDIRQARRALPDDLRRAWCDNPASGKVIMEAWYNQVYDEAQLLERGLKDPHTYLVGQEEKTDLEIAGTPGPMEKLFVDLLTDAATVYSQGLQNPIVVAPAGTEQWIIEQGERRTLMYWALATWVDAEHFAAIPAVKVDAISALRQAAENQARKDLCAIEQARQLANILMELHQEGQSFVPITDLSDYGYYSQAANLPVPYGRGHEITAVTGLSARVIRHYRDLLGMPELVWNLASMLRWPEGKLRAMLKEAGGDAEQLLRIARLEAGLKERSTPPVPDLEDRVFRKAERVYTWMQKAASMKDDEVQALSREHRQQLIQAAQDVIRRFGGS